VSVIDTTTDTVLPATIPVGLAPGGLSSRLTGARLYVANFGAASVTRPPFALRDLLPYYALILIAIALLCWLLAIGIVAPLRQTARVVDRFGQGDLTARTRTRRRDEIGDACKPCSPPSDGCCRTSPTNCAHR
jgi:methyl-accepting chemotaxis protein